MCRERYNIKTLQEIKSNEPIFSRLSKIDWNFTKDDTRYLTHDIHPYPAKFIPQIPRYLISNLTRPGETVWDPFGGSGTTALEAILLNRKAISTDSNPLSTVIGEAKTTTLFREDELALEDWVEKLSYLTLDKAAYRELVLDSFQERQYLIPNIANIKYWFNEEVIADLTYLRASIASLKSENQRKIAKVAFSRTVSKASNQDSETRYSRRFKNIAPSEAISFFIKDMKLCMESSRELGTLLNFRQAIFATVDLRQPCVGKDLNKNKNLVIPSNSVDLIVTSPPYPNVNDYHLYHRFRLFWLGYNPKELASIEIGSHLRHQKEKTGFEHYLSEMEKCLLNCKESLRPGRFAIFVLGDGVYSGKTYSTITEVNKIAKQIGFETVGILDRLVHKTKRSFISAARRTDKEQLLILRKPLEKITFSLYAPNYKLWQYENVLRRQEIESRLQIPSETNIDGKWSIDANPLYIDKIRLLAFTHHFSSENFPCEPTWQALLENGFQLSSSTKKSSTYLTHGLHPYKGKFYPQLAKSLINCANLHEGNKILDPFCGSGTMILEGYLNGLISFGCDSNPLAVKIARAKTEILSIEPYFRDRMFSQVLSSLQKQALDTSPDRWLNKYTDQARKELKNWFPDKVLCQIAVIFSIIKEVPQPILQNFLEIVLSSIIRQISQQDPRDLRIRRRKIPIEDAPAIELFSQALEKQREKLLNFDKIRNDCPVILGQTKIWEGDSRDYKSFSAQKIKASYFDAIITSPPYATALPYIDTDRLSILILLGMSSIYRKPIEEELIGTREITISRKKHYELLIENNDFRGIHSKKAVSFISKLYRINRDADVGFRRKNQASLLYKYFQDMSSCIINFNKILKNNGQAFLILGDNITTTEQTVMPIETVKMVKEIADNLKWELREEIKISVTRENYKHLKNAITENSILWFQKKS